MRSFLCGISWGRDATTPSTLLSLRSAMGDDVSEDPQLLARGTGTAKHAGPAGAH